MNWHQNFRGFKFFQRLSRLLLESVVFMESNGGFYFRQKRIHLRNMAEICKIQGESNYSLRFNCGGYGFSKLMWQSLGTSIKDALNPAASTRATIQKKNSCRREKWVCVHLLNRRRRLSVHDGAGS